MTTSDFLPEIDDDILTRLAEHCAVSSRACFTKGIYAALLLCRLVLNGRHNIYIWDGGGSGTAAKILEQLKKSGLVVDVTAHPPDWAIYVASREVVDLVNEMVRGIDPSPVGLKDRNG